MQINGIGVVSDTKILNPNGISRLGGMPMIAGPKDAPDPEPSLFKPLPGDTALGGKPMIAGPWKDEPVEIIEPLPTLVTPERLGGNVMIAEPWKSEPIEVIKPEEPRLGGNIMIADPWKPESSVPSIDINNKEFGKISCLTNKDNFSNYLFMQTTANFVVRTPSMNEQAVQNLISQIDIDGSGQITQEEFDNWVKQENQRLQDQLDGKSDTNTNNGLQILTNFSNAKDPVAVKAKMDALSKLTFEDLSNFVNLVSSPNPSTEQPFVPPTFLKPPALPALPVMPQQPLNLPKISPLDDILKDIEKRWKEIMGRF